MLFQDPIAVNKGQQVSGTLIFTANEKFSYSITMTAGIDGTNVKTSNKINLHDQVSDKITVGSFVIECQFCCPIVSLDISTDLSQQHTDYLPSFLLSIITKFLCITIALNFPFYDRLCSQSLIFLDVSSSLFSIRCTITWTPLQRAYRIPPPLLPGSATLTLTTRARHRVCLTMLVRSLHVSGFRNTWHLRTIPILPCAV